MTPATGSSSSVAAAVFPRPISESLDRALAKAIATSNQFEASVSTKGAEASLGWSVAPGWSVGAWGGIEWNGAREAGVRVRKGW